MTLHLSIMRIYKNFNLAPLVIHFKNINSTNGNDKIS